jgi:hypothetical protein
MITLIILAMLDVCDFISNLSVFPTVNQTFITALHPALYNLKLQLTGYNWIFPVDIFYMGVTLVVVCLTGVGFAKLVRWIGTFVSAGIL